MRAFLKCMLAALLVLALLLVPAEAIFGKKIAKKKAPQEEQQPSGKASAELGLEAFQQLFQDPSALQEIMAMQNDPELMREVEALMDDPEFQAYMEEYMQSPEVKQAMKKAEQLANDPEALANFQAQLASALGGDGKDSAQLGLETLAATVRDPAAMTQAMELLKDPKVAQEVEAMMKDPAFQAEMQRITNSPLFKEAMEQAQAMTAELQKDPAKMAAFMEDLQKEMGNFAAAAGTGRAAGGRARVEL